jgi:hypothetical protein
VIAPAPRRCLALALGVCALLGGARVDGAATKAHPKGVTPRTGRSVPPTADLVKAAKKNDRAALERLAGRFGVARLGEAARSNDAATAQAALATIPLARGAVLLAGLVAERLEAPDPGVASAAARTLGALLSGDAPTALVEWEVPADGVARACAGLATRAARGDLPLPARLEALDALALARPTCGGGDVAKLAKERDPAVRRAALLALSPADKVSAAPLRDALGDADAGVSAAAAASLCRGVDPAAPRAKDATLDAATATARALLAASTTRPEDAVELLACVASARTPADRALLETLRLNGAPPVRARAAALLGPAPGKTE